MGRYLAALAVALGICLGMAGSAQATGFLAGAGEQDTTPPPAGTGGTDPASFALCSQPLFPDRGHFALQEPFSDLNGNGQWDPGADLSGSAPSGPPEPFCDANGNGRWDGIYADNGRGPATGVHDPIDVRAVAISDGHDKPVVYASVDQIGIFDYYTEDARAQLQSTYNLDADLVVSADHNESSPDSIGLYGAGQTPLSVGVRSGIDEYYMTWLDGRIAAAAAAAVRNLRPAALYANQTEGPIASGAGGSTYPLLSGMRQHISDQFPTSVALPGDDRVAAVDPKLGVLQAREASGTPIFTLMSLAAHNQEMGNAGRGLSADWPGAFEHAFDASHAGLAEFLVGDNGSEEDPDTNPQVIPNGSENHSDQATQYVQAKATGESFAALVASAAGSAQQLTPGTVRLTRRQFCVPLENNGFVALAAAGDFGKRQGWACDQNGSPLAPVPNGSVAPTASTQFRTFASYADVGPDLQLIDNPGEAFPALMLGSPFGVEEESCNRPNPAVPTWHAHALYRFQVGLADDLLGYLIPAWGFASGTPGLFNNDGCYNDMNAHRHKLESESVGPTGANDVANTLTAMLDAEPDPASRITAGRFVLANGAYSRWPTSAVGMLIPAPGQSALDPSAGTLIGAPGTAGFGARAVDATGYFMDYDGQPQATPDVTTRGMLVLGSDGCVAARYYVNVFPALDSSRPLGPTRTQPPVLSATCPASSRGGVPEIQRGVAARVGLAGGACHRGRRPTSSVAHRVVLARGGRLVLSGRARSFRRCGRRTRVARVTVTIVHRGPGCRYVLPDGRLSTRRTCRRQLQLLVNGREHWTLHLRLHVPRGRYTIVVRAYDTLGGVEAGGHRADLLRLRVA